MIKSSLNRNKISQLMQSLIHKEYTHHGITTLKVWVSHSKNEEN